MQSKKSLVFFRAVLAIAALFAAADAFAFCDLCEAPSNGFPIAVSKNGWTIEIVSIEPLTRGCTGYNLKPGFPPVSFTTCYTWTYRIYKTGTNYSISGLNFAAMLIPDCCREPYVYVDPSKSYPANLKTFPVAQGEPTVGFGRYIELGSVIKNTPDSSAYLELVFNTNLIGTLPAIIKSADVITFEIPGPACTADPLKPYSPEIKLEEFFIQEIKIRIEWNEANPCDAVVSYQLPNSSTWIYPPATDIFIEDSPLVECGPVEGNQKCQRCRFTTKGSPQYTYIKVGKKTYKVCICDCDGTPDCTD